MKPWTQTTATALPPKLRPPGPRIYHLRPGTIGPASTWHEELPRIAGLNFDWVYLDPPHLRLGRTSADGDGELRPFIEAAEGCGLKVLVGFAAPNVDTERATDLASAPWTEIERLLALGASGFLCNRALAVPSFIWQSLIERAKGLHPQAIFVADALGHTVEEALAVSDCGFDYLLNSFAWWDLREPWALAQYERLRLGAASIAFPDSAAAPRAEPDGNDADPPLSMVDPKLRYGVAALFSTGVLMPAGYEFGDRSRSKGPAEPRPDISRCVSSLNALRAELPATNVEGAQWRLGPPDAPCLALLRLDAGHVTAARNGTLVLANTGSAESAVDLGELMADAGGELEEWRDATPSELGSPPVEARELGPGHKLRLSPGEMHVFAIARREPLRRGRMAQSPDGSQRVLIERVRPQIDGGAAPVKRIVGEVLDVSADIVADGHESIAAEICYALEGDAQWQRTPMRFFDNDRWIGSFPLERNATYRYTIEAWRDRFTSWREDLRKKEAAGQAVHLETIEGVHLAEKAAAERRDGDAAGVIGLVGRLKALPGGSKAQHEMLLDEANGALISQHLAHENLSRLDRILEVRVDRLAARFSSWYELFPRSQSGDGKRHGTFRDVIARLPYVRDLGFDVLYFPPIHPIGSSNRKGKNNAVKAMPGDVGSVYAIGAEEGGHDAIHPMLGTLAEFRELVDAVHDHGLEIALDFAVQCSPDHPWIKQHPEWFEWRPDGSIKYAENPPKKYEDIVNLDLYSSSFHELWAALRDVVLFWVGEGVRIFRVDNPHTKPLPFWRWLIAEVNNRHPDVIFLSEAFTRPKMMKALAKAGFQQSYTYFTWRNTKVELTEYMTELATTEMSEYYRPNFFVNTPDINPYYLQESGRAGFIVRATLAATLSSAWGIYSGFELCEATPIPGREEYLNSEKYELKAWDWNRPGNIRDHVTRLNAIRRENPCLHDFRNIVFLNAWNDQILAYARLTPRRDNCLLVLVNLDPRNRQECSFEIPLWEYGLPDDASLQAEDLLSGGRFWLHGKTQRIALDPAVRPVMIWRLNASAPGAAAR